jgi:hypothetical protein
MSGINVGDVAARMAASFVASLKQSAPGIETYAENEAQKFAVSIASIGKLVDAGTIGHDEAKLHLEIQENASKAVFTGIQGITLLATEAAINAALGVVKDVVNTALGFPLI